MSERLTDNPSLFRLRVRYGKRDRLKYLGHLEVIHTIERIVRRGDCFELDSMRRAVSPAFRTMI